MKRHDTNIIQQGIFIISILVLRYSIQAATLIAPLTSKRYVSCWKTSHGVLSTAIMGNTQASSQQQIERQAYPVSTSSYQHALDILKAGVAAVDPATAISSHLSVENPHTLKLLDSNTGRTHLYKITDYDSLLVVSLGKAASTMAEQTLKILSQSFCHVNLVGCIVVTKDHHITDAQRLNIQNLCSTWKSENHSKDSILYILECGHPIPDQRSAEAAQRIIETVQNYASPKTLIIFCISGGGSSLVTAPIPPLSLVDLQQTNQALLASGMDISQMNTIRKKIDAIKGGKLAVSAYPSTVISLILSDVIGDDLSSIASGPTAQPLSPQSLDDLIQYNQLESKLPPSVLQLLTEKESDINIHHPIFTSKISKNTKLCENVLVGNNQLALLAAAHTAKSLGYHPIILGSTIEGEAKVVAGMYISMSEYLLHRQRRSEAFTMMMSSSSQDSSNQEGPIALLAGGETTVTLPQNHLSTGNLGGRNQEIALTAAMILSKSKSVQAFDDIVLGSLGTDGTDGPTDAAGAIVHGNTVKWIESMNGGSITAKGALQNHDAYNFFMSVHNDKGEDPTFQHPLIKTGPTGTNVADICVVLIR